MESRHRQNIDIGRVRSDMYALPEGMGRTVLVKNVDTGETNIVPGSVSVERVRFETSRELGVQN